MRPSRVRHAAKAPVASAAADPVGAPASVAKSAPADWLSIAFLWLGGSDTVKGDALCGMNPDADGDGHDGDGGRATGRCGDGDAAGALAEANVACGVAAAAAPVGVRRSERVKGSSEPSPDNSPSLNDTRGAGG